MPPRKAKRVVKPKSDAQKMIIQKPSIQRIYRRAGIKRAKEATFDNMRDSITHFIEDFVANAIISMTNDKRRTLKDKDADFAAELMGLESAVGGFKKLAKPKKKERKEGAATKRKRPGTLAKQEVNREQKRSGESRSITPARFERLLKSTGNDIAGMKIKYSASFIEITQTIVEEYFINMCNKARRVMEHAGRETLKTDDLDLARALVKECM